MTLALGSIMSVQKRSSRTCVYSSVFDQLYSKTLMTQRKLQHNIVNQALFSPLKLQTISVHLYAQSITQLTCYW